MTDHAEHHEHIVPVPVYLGVFGALMVFWALSRPAAREVPDD